MSDAAGEQARSWLKNHGFPDTGMTLLLIHRLQARRQVHGHLASANMAGAAGAAAILLSESAGVRVAGLCAVIVAVLALRLLARRRRRAVEREIAAMLPCRVAHTVPLKPHEVVGAGFGFAAALLHLGAGVLVLTAGRATHEPGTLLAVFALIVVLAVVDGIEVAVIVGRPALAEDAQSLAVDDVLRTEDARLLLTSLMPLVLSWTVLDLRWEMSGPMLASLALIALLFSLGWAAEHARAPRPREVLS